MVTTNVLPGYYISASQVWDYNLGYKRLFIRKNYVEACNSLGLSYYLCVLPFSWLYDDYTSDINSVIGFDNCGDGVSSATSFLQLANGLLSTNIIPSGINLISAFRLSCGTNSQRSTAILGAYLSDYAYQSIQGNVPSISYSLFGSCSYLNRIVSFQSTYLSNNVTYQAMYAELWQDTIGNTVYLAFQGTNPTNSEQVLADLSSGSMVLCIYGDGICGNTAVSCY